MTNLSLKTFDDLAREGLFAVPAMVIRERDGAKVVKGVMSHAKGNDAIRTESDWTAARSRIEEQVEGKGYNIVAIKTGALSNVFVLDIDTKDKPNEDIMAGMPLWQQLITKAWGS
jgi:hypothetical protein